MGVSFPFFIDQIVLDAPFNMFNEVTQQYSCVVFPCNYVLTLRVVDISEVKEGKEDVNITSRH